RIAANINIDGIGIWGKTKDVSAIGLGKSSLDRDIVAIAAMQGRTVKPDEFPDRGVFYRSDQFNFARIGVPAAYIKSGTEVIGKPEGWGRQQMEHFTATDYHQPSDEYRDSWDLSGAIDDVQLCFYLGMAVADAPTPAPAQLGRDCQEPRREGVSAARRGRFRLPEGFRLRELLRPRWGAAGEPAAGSRPTGALPGRDSRGLRHRAGGPGVRPGL